MGILLRSCRSLIVRDSRKEIRECGWGGESLVLAVIHVC